MSACAPRTARRVRQIATAALAAALLGVALAFAAAPTAGAAVVKVTAGDVDGAGQWFSADTRNAGTGSFEAGPPTAPLGAGSFELATPANPDKVQLLTSAYDATRLDAIEAIGYATYRDPSSTGFAAALGSLNMRVDTDASGAPDAYLVYEPYQDHGNAAVSTGVWQTWDAHRGGAARWWINTGAGGCGQATPCAWSAILAALPDATIREGASCGPGSLPKSPCPGSLGVNQGSFNAATTTNVDGLYVDVGGRLTTYDFEPPVGPPGSKDDCKDGGWQRFDSPRTFRNQGDCVSFVARGR